MKIKKYNTAIQHEGNGGAWVDMEESADGSWVRAEIVERLEEQNMILTEALRSLYTSDLRPGMDKIYAIERLIGHLTEDCEESIRGIQNFRANGIERSRQNQD